MKRRDAAPVQQPPSQPEPWSADELGDLLVARAPQKGERTAADDPLVQAAAVLSHFDPTTLRPVEPLGGDDRPAALRLLVNCSTVVREGGQGRWALRDDVRKSALRRLAAAGSLHRALQANPAPEGARQQMLGLLLRGDPPPVDKLSIPDLKELHHVCGWLRGVPGVRLPDEGAIRARIARAELLRPFHHLVGTHFRGRRDELDRLRTYVGVVDPESRLRRTASRVRRAVGEVFSLRKAPPLFVHGPGGAGKSTLLAKFILEHAEAAEQFRFPFVYLDFDRPGLLGDDPAILLIEIAAQLEVQHPGMGFGDLGRRWSDTLIRSAQGAAHAEAERIFETSTSHAQLHLGEWLMRLREPLNALLGPSRPFLLVLDTFEEAQYRSGAYVEALWSFLDAFQEVVPRTRTVLAGRAPLDGPRIDDMALGDFDEEAALGFLEHHGVRPPEAKALFSQLGGNPLTLMLAAEVVRLEGADTSGIRGLNRRRLWIISASAAQIQGQLYDRILSHIHDERVRRLAHPGLVLRRVTPALILEVLAEPCGVEVQGARDADALFREFSREVSLVTVEPDGSLRHRSDIRRLMLPLVRDAERERADEIHRRTVAFYQRQEGPAARAEEIYHRLCLGEPRGHLDTRWDPAAAPYLGAGALEELPPAGQAYLAARLGLEVSASVKRAADQQTWELDAERHASELVKVGRLDEALKVVGGRKERLPASRLYVLEAMLLSRQRKHHRALEVVRRGLSTLGGEESGGTALDLALLEARIHEVLHMWHDAARGYEEVTRLAQRRRDARLVWEGGLARLALHHAGLAPEPIDVLDYRARLIEAFQQLPVARRSVYAGLLRCVAGEIADSSPSICLEIARAAGPGPVSSLQARAYVMNAPKGTMLTQALAGVDAAGEMTTGARWMTDAVSHALSRTLDMLEPAPDEVRALGAALRAFGLSDRSDPTPAGRAVGGHGLPHLHYNPPLEVTQAGRRLAGESYRELLRQLDHAEVLVALYERSDGVFSAPLIDSADRLAEHQVPHLSLRGYYALWVAQASRGFGESAAVRAERLYPSTGIATLISPTADL